MHVGLDAHKKKTVGFVVRANGEREGPFALETTKERLRDLAEKIRGGVVYVEASTSGKGVVRFLRSEGVDAVLVCADALMMTLRRKKNDQEDALHLALVGQVGAIHAAYLPTEYEDELRSLTRRRYDIVNRISSLVCQAKAILARNLVPEPPGRLANDTCRRRWHALTLPPTEKYVLDEILQEIKWQHERLDDVRLQLQKKARGDTVIERLLTIPGLDVLNASCIRGEYGDMKRFPSGKHAASYAGITPPNWESGDKKFHGRITRKGSPYLRHALVEAAWQLVAHPGRLKKAYARLKPKIGARKAAIAIARRLAGVIWTMTTREEDYDDVNQDLVEQKRWRHSTITRLLDEGRRDIAVSLLNSHDARRWRRSHPDA